MIHIDPRLYVEVVPYTGPHAPVPHPITDAGLLPDRIYKVLGSYTPSETAEAYLVLANPDRQLWFISNRHLRAYALLDSDAFSLPKPLHPTRHRLAALDGTDPLPTHTNGL